MKHIVKFGQGYKQLTGRISGGQVIIQPFIPLYTCLDAVSIDFATYCRINTANLKFEILDKSENTMYQETVSMSILKDNEFHIFKTSVMFDSDSIYYIKLSGDGEDGNSVTAKYSLTDVPIRDTRLRLYMFEPFVDGELSCILTYSDIADKLLEYRNGVVETCSNTIDELKKNSGQSLEDSIVYDANNLGKSPFSIIVTAHNSGISAINLALHMNAKRIVLLGFDCSYALDMFVPRMFLKNNSIILDRTNDGRGRKAWKKWINELTAKQLDERQVKIVNASPGSFCNMWPKMKPEDAVAWVENKF